MPASKHSVASLSLQPRDFTILCGLYESRVMTCAHIAALCFDGRREAAKKRLQKLKAAGFIGERMRFVNEPSVLFLTRTGFKVIGDEGLLLEYPSLGASPFDRRARVSNITLRHELEIMDVKAAFHSAVSRAPAFRIAEFSTWPLRYQFESGRPGHGSNVLVKPDGFIRIHEKEADGGISEHTPFFLEVDRSSETLDTLIARAGSYLEHYRSGGFAAKNGASRGDYKDFPFRVLMVLKSAERRNNTAERLLLGRPPILTQVCLSTLKEATSDPLGAVWIQPRDYRDLLHGTRFDPERRRSMREYRSQPEREALVERKISKIRLLQS